MSTIAAILKRGSRTLAEVSPSPSLDAELLLAHALRQPRTHLRAWPEKPVDPEAAAAYTGLLESRRRGMPVAYLLGKREFWSRDFFVTPEVLIPRPETELLVECSLALLPRNQPMTIADLGTGCGAIAITLGLEYPTARVLASDRSSKALTVANYNRARWAANNVKLCQGHWLSPLAPRCFDLIVSNPPYIAADDPHLGQGDVRFEPKAALVSGNGGLTALATIARQARNRLKPGGWLILEHGWDQHKPLTQLLEDLGYREVYCHRDWQNHPRVTRAQWSF